MLGKHKEEKKQKPKQREKDPMDYMSDPSSLYKKPSKYGRYP